MRRSDQSGFTILYALGILALLSTFALVFARVMGFERQASNHFVDTVRARLAARAGVERVTAELRRVAFNRHYSDPWADRWGYMALPPPALPPGDQVDLLTTTQPSFSEQDPARTMLGAPLAFSGRLGDTYGNQDMLVYKLRVIDCAAQINLNHSDVPSITRMLSAVLQVELGLGAGQADGLASTLINGRPPGGFSSKTEIGSRLVAAGLTDVQWKRLQDDLTTFGWVDGSVIRPWNLNGTPMAALEPLPRSPINLNTASEAVLTAMFAGIQADNKYGTFTIPLPAARQIAQAIVAQRGGPSGGGSGTGFTPFRTWREFEQWVDEQLPAGALGGCTAALKSPAGAGSYDLVNQLLANGVPFRDLIKAVANPNSSVTKFGLLPNHGGYRQQVGRLVDKSDLVTLSTDGCFDAMGMYEITSLGLVLHPHETQGMQVGAAVTQQVVVQVYRPFRLTTQDDFERNRALMVPGNTIPNNNDTSPRVGMNAPPSTADWPGMVSWPNYSLQRQGADLALKPEFPAASWDGYLTLTNIIANKIADPDFALGWSEGILGAVKVRAHTEPKDEFPTGQAKIQPPPVPSPYGGKNVAALSAVMNGTGNQPRLRAATNATYASLLDEDATNPNLLFTAGAALVNTGVLMSPDRDATPGTNGTPRFVAYDSNNLDLTRGTSIRFWVQPLVDPHAHPEEVLLSFVGSKDGTKRQVGFRVFKEALPTGVVNIVLEAIGTSEPDESGVNVEWNWATQLNGAAPRIEIDVTPQGPSYVNGALSPEWLPGSWHWVVVNIGPGKLGFDEETQYFASLQVDKKKATQQLFYKGNKDTPQGLHEYGELLGHAVGVTSFFEPLTAATINSGRARGWIVPRLLGDYYHCNAGRNVVHVTKIRTFGAPGDPLGPALVFAGNHVPFYPWVDPTAGDQNPPGTYVVGPGWPSIIPFPVLSYNHKARLDFYDTPAPGSAGGAFGGSGAVVQNLTLWKTDPSGSWNATFPPFRHPMYGPDATVTVPDPGFYVPSGGLIPPGPLSPDGHPGDAEYWIGLTIMWDEDHYDTGCQYCAPNGPNVPPVASSPSIEWDPNNPIYGEDHAYAVHNSAMTNKVGMPATVHPLDQFRSWVRVTANAGGLPHPQGQEPNFPSGPPAVYPITYLDDDCHGCEQCDVDGPVFIGGEPSGASNYAGGNLATADPSTMAEAVFDNVLFVNGDMARRTDWPGANLANTAGMFDPVTGAPVNYADPAKDFEDRFFETNLAATLGSASTGQGAIYHRGLIELRDMLGGRLGTMTWTSYDTRDDLRFEVGLWQLNETSGSTLWAPTNSGLLPNANAPTWAYTADAAVGVKFAGTAGALFAPDPTEGPGVTTDPATGDSPLYVMGIRLQDYNAPRVSLPAPLLQSPVFEDLTITVINERPVVLHAEEGVEE